MKFFLTIPVFICSSALYAQEVNSVINTGNEAYRKGEYSLAATLYKKALETDAGNTVAMFNLGNALQKQKANEAAEKYYEKVAESGDRGLRSKALYNRGVVQAYEQKLVEAIASFKAALVLSPEDNETRENLQKAINELKKRQHNSPKPSDNRQQKEQKQKKPPSPEMLEQKFSELRDKERQLQKQLQKKSGNTQPEKDW